MIIRYGDLLKWVAFAQILVPMGSAYVTGLWTIRWISALERGV
jgi:hypothetical protein